MKKKSLAMLAAAGLMAATCAYIAPAMADDTTSPTAQTPDQSMPNNGAMPDSNSNSTSAPSTSDTNNTGANSGSSTDTGTPDTATGDDDY